MLWSVQVWYLNYFCLEFTILMFGVEPVEVGAFRLKKKLNMNWIYH